MADRNMDNVSIFKALEDALKHQAPLLNLIAALDAESAEQEVPVAVPQPEVPLSLRIVGEPPNAVVE